MSFPPVPPEVKSIAHFLKIADEHDNRNVVISYWARMYACQSAMKLMPGKKPPEVSKLLIAIMDWLEQTKSANHNVEGITNETVAQALIEQYVLQLFTYADSQDRAEVFNKNTVKAFYTAGIIMDILDQFGELSEEMNNKRKYAKWKASYIHNCLKNGEKPTAGGPDEYLQNVTHVDKDEDDETENANNSSSNNDSINSFPAPAPAPSPVTPGVTPIVPVIPQPNITPAQPFQPSVVPSNNTTNGNISAESIQKAQKFCKYATSALNYDDVPTAVDNLKKALALLENRAEN